MIPDNNRNLPNSADVIIIGGGVIGLSIAYNLALKNFGNIVLFERGYLGGGSTGRCGAAIRTQFGNVETIKLMSESIKLWKKLSQELQFNVMFEQKGYLFVSISDEQADYLKKGVKLQNSLGVRSRFLEPKEVSDICPYINTKKLSAGAIHDKDGVAHHDAVVWGYANKARQLGVKIHTFSNVDTIGVEKGEIKSVGVNSQTIKAPIIVNAAGPYAHLLAQKINVDLPIRPKRQETAVTESYKNFLGPSILCRDNGFFCRQTLRGEVMIGATLPYETNSMSVNSSLEFLRKVSEDTLELFPSFKDLRILRQWAGLFEMTPDDSPILGKTEKVKGFIQANGFSGHGFMQAPIIGITIADLILSGKTPEIIRPYKLNRFKEGNLIQDVV